MKGVYFYPLFVLILWVWVTNVYQAFTCPEMSQTQLFIHIPKSLILDFKHCK